MELKKKLIVIIGETGAGKSTLTNILTDTKSAEAGSNPKGISKSITFHEGRIKDRPISVADLPGFGDRTVSVSDLKDLWNT